MPWDMKKCRWGVPSKFTDAGAATAVQNADFAASVFVNISVIKQETKQAFTYYVVDDYRICVVGHVHKDKSGHWTVAGNSYIPGWENWETITPSSQVGIIGSLQPGGTFPGDDRYPHPVP